LAALGAIIVAEERYADHAQYRLADADRLATRARDQGLLPVTTEKDAVKLRPLWNEATHGPLAILPVALAVADASALQSLLARLTASARRD
jgi:tetraacyldisaccharide 4'-kinase